jgi:hypothetical protein
MFNPANSPDLRRGIKFVEAKPEVPSRSPPRPKPKGLSDEKYKQRISSKLRNPEFYEFAIDLHGGGVLQDMHRFPRHPHLVLDYLKEWTGEEGQPKYDENLPHPRPTTIREPIKLAVCRSYREQGRDWICPISKHRAD